METYETIPLHNKEDEAKEGDVHAETPAPPAVSPRPPLQALRRTPTTKVKGDTEEGGDGVRHAGVLTRLASWLLDGFLPFSLYFG